MEDASIIFMIKEILDILGIKFSLEINSLGCKNCMPLYRKKIISFLENNENLCDDCNRRKIFNPIRVLDCKNEQCKNILKKAPLLVNDLCKSCDDDFLKLKLILDSFNISYVVNPKLVRGLDYYSKTAFEFISQEIGSQNAIAGGGRYDRLVEFLGGKETPAIGFAIGIERLLDILKKQEQKRSGYFIGALCEEALNEIFRISILKRKNYTVFINYQIKSLANQLKQADKSNARYCVCIGENELNNKTVWIKDLELKQEKEIQIDKFLE